MDWNKFYDHDQLNMIINEPFITGFIVIASIWVNMWLIRKKAIVFRFGTEDSTPVLSILKVIFELLIFSTLFLELRYQIYTHFSSEAFIRQILWLYVFLFFAVYILLKQGKFKQIGIFYGILIISVCCYIFPYMHIVNQVRNETLTPIWGYFAMHYLAIPAIIVIFIFLFRKARVITFGGLNKNWIYWFITIASVIILSLETDNTILMIFSNRVYDGLLLSYSHSIAYPILWGTISFILMIWGMKYKNRTLRIISLSLFALIIAKLYIYDIWKMNQTGRIIAFIFLGLLFLLVSFLYQKLKIILQKKNE